MEVQDVEKKELVRSHVRARLALRVSVASLAACLIAGADVSESDKGMIRGTVISGGGAPQSETLAAMRARDASRAAKNTQAVFVPHMPLDPRPQTTEKVTDERGEEHEFSTPGPLAPQTVGTEFDAVDYNYWIPPDTMGAIGPNHFVEVINGSVAIYTRSGTQLSHVTLSSFFSFFQDGTNYPRGYAFDPRVIYDRRSERWFASALEIGDPAEEDNHIVFAVSRTDDPTGVWDKYLIPAGVPSSGTTYFSDFETLATDDNGVYFGVRIFPSFGFSFAKIIATEKASLIGPTPSLSAVYEWSNITDMYSTPQPAHNHDAVSASGRAWFAASRPWSLTYEDIRFRRLTWSGGVPSLDGSSSTISTPAFAHPMNAPANGSGTDVHVGDYRLQMAVIRNDRLWTCRHIGVNSTGGSSGADRMGCEWLELDVSSATPTLEQSGRIYDSSAADPRFYYYPSIMVNGQGHAVIGFSGSKSTEYIGCYTCGRLATDAAGTMGVVTQFRSGSASYQRTDGNGRNRWGDYSYTSLDPNNDMSLWTIQEYAKSPANTWGTYVAEMLSPAPLLVNPNTNGAPGETGYVLGLRGMGFYDPGTGYVDRLDVALTGGAVNGITNYGIIYGSPSNAIVTFDIVVNASPGPRTVVLTNPDGQAAAAVDGFMVVPEVGMAMWGAVFLVMTVCAGRRGADCKLKIAN